MIRVKEIAGKRMDLHDQRALNMGRRVLDHISAEYRDLTKQQKRGEQK